MVGNFWHGKRSVTAEIFKIFFDLFKILCYHTNGTYCQKMFPIYFTGADHFIKAL